LVLPRACSRSTVAPGVGAGCWNRLAAAERIRWPRFLGTDRSGSGRGNDDDRNKKNSAHFPFCCYVRFFFFFDFDVVLESEGETEAASDKRRAHHIIKRK
jgi:hypothetical protein